MDETEFAAFRVAGIALLVIAILFMIGAANAGLDRGCAGRAGGNGRSLRHARLAALHELRDPAGAVGRADPHGLNRTRNWKTPDLCLVNFLVTIAQRLCARIASVGSIPVQRSYHGGGHVQIF